jgi:hypothetical protein
MPTTLTRHIGEQLRRKQHLTVVGEKGMHRPRWDQGTTPGRRVKVSSDGWPAGDMPGSLPAGGRQREPQARHGQHDRPNHALCRPLASHRSRRPEQFTPLVRRTPRPCYTPSPTSTGDDPARCLRRGHGSCRPGGCLPHARPDAHRCRPGSGGCTPALLAPRTPRTALQRAE